MTGKASSKPTFVGTGDLYSNASKPWSATDFVIAALITVFVFVCYWGVRDGEFLYDDRTFVKDNKVIRNIRPVHRFFTSRLAYSPHGEFNIYRPLTPLSYAISLKLHGLNKTGFHLTNILLHCGCSLALFVVLKRMFGNTLLAGLPAIIFAVHPASTESVSWIAQRSGLLSLLFFLLALRLHQAAIYHIPRRNKMLAMAVLMYACSVFSKEMGITLPAVLLIHDMLLVNKSRRLPRRTAFAYYGALVGVAVIFLVARTLVIGGIAQQTWHGGTFYRNTLLVITSLGFYVRLAVWPLNLSVKYLDFIPSEFTSPQVLTGLMSAGLLAGVAVMFYRIERRVTFGITWFAVTLLPVSNIIPIHTMYNDRFLYVPLVGFCMALAGLFTIVMRNRKRQMTAAVIGFSSVLVLLGGFGTIQRNRDWQNWEKLLKAVLRVNENDTFAWRELGKVFQGRGDVDEARQHWQKALELNPDDWTSRGFLGISYSREGKELIKQGKVKEGEVFYEKAMKQIRWAVNNTEPDFRQAAVYVSMATISRYHGKLDTAKDQLRRAIKLDRLCSSAYPDLIKLLQRGTGTERQEAIEVILEAHQLWPGNTQLARKAAGMLLTANRPYDALDLLSQTINVLTPGAPERQRIERLATELKNKLNETHRRRLPR